MANKKAIVINTSPLLALIAAFDSLDILKLLYDVVFVPCEVGDEINYMRAVKFGADVFNADTFLSKEEKKLTISTFLSNSLDIGEASVIQLALNNNISTVCIDEAVGRRVARLNNLNLTGSIGIIIKAIQQGSEIDFMHAVSNMQNKNIYISDSLILEAQRILNNEQ